MADDPQAIAGTTASAKTMVDGTLRIAIDIEPADMKAAFLAFGNPGTLVAVAILNLAQDPEPEPTPTGAKQPGPYGGHARALKLSAFFRSPKVWMAIGTDKEYLEWVKRQPSAESGDFSEYHDDGKKYNVPAHVRRVHHGSGTSIKPQYSAIPLTKAEHDLTHRAGDSAIGDDEWWDQQRIKYVQKWCWETLREKLGYDSWSHVPPEKLVAWCQDHDLASITIYEGHGPIL